MTVGKDETMDHFAATDDDFDALLEASSLGAPHVLAETDPIPAAARQQMAEALTLVAQSVDDECEFHADETDGGLPIAPALWHSLVCQLDATYSTQHLGLWAPSGRGRSSFFEWMFAALFKIEIAADAHHSATEAHRKLFAHLKRAAESLALTPAVGTWGAGKSLTRLIVVEEVYANEVCHPAVSWWRTCTATGLSPDRGSTEPGVPRKLLLGVAGCEVRQPASASASGATLDTWLSLAQMTDLLVDVRHGISRHQQGILPGLQTDGIAGVLPKKAAAGYVNQSVSITPPDTALPVILSGASPLPLPQADLEWLLWRRWGPYVPGAGRLLLPANRVDADAPERHVRSADSHHCKAMRAFNPELQVPRARMWNQTTAEGEERHAQLWMLFHPSEDEQPLAARLCTRLVYRTSDPYAVEARFNAGMDEETVWVFARNLLLEGLERATGVGDVVVWPETVPQAQQQEPRTYVRLSSPEGTALLSAGSKDLRAFLDMTRSLVAYGQEHSQLAAIFDTLDMELGQLTCPGAND